MKMRFVFWTTLFFFILIAFFSTGKAFLFSANLSWEKEMEQLDHQIENLIEVKKGLEAKALRHEQEAQRLQFVQEEFLEARRHSKLADKYHCQVAKVEKRIHKLEKKKERLMQEKKQPEGAST